MNEFDDVSDLDEVFGPLRSCATPAELSQETAILERMVNARRTAEGKHMFTSRRTRVATIVAAGILGFGGMAAASPSLLGDEPIDEPVEVEPLDDEIIEPSEEVEPVEIEVEEVEVEEVEVEEDEVEEVEVEVVEVEPVAEVEPVEVEPIAPVESPQVAPAEVAPVEVVFVDDPATDFDEATCLPGNHGATVSAVARGEFGDDVSVPDAARSSCGKTAGEIPETQTEPELEPEAEREGGYDKGGASNGKANGKANGNGGKGKRGG